MVAMALNAKTRIDGESETFVTHSLRAEGHDASEDGTGRGTPLIAFDTTQITSKANRNNPKPGDPCHPLAAGAHPPTIVNARQDPIHGDQEQPLDSDGVSRAVACSVPTTHGMPSSRATMAAWQVRPP